ncbi:MAG TPA: bifunctional diaminohydroxyphosphoribosylaminopyrimidine deaminase/5-amino-6-(5-phosphoribosylamino)uracil reductase RibD [Candidatus Acidoferrum sp.]|nr:bifunctional diaminohydroxyphosphoribosylaminopyrimidine deaminase/5-amino-6-(5-phosphoribosylamino)uracil reductase RibD [Candidatus Acidoferrum sp.]
MDEHDIRFMQHALSLARRGIGLTSPNPTVGCVIVREGEIVGEGFHEYEKRDHAEIVALKAAGEKARGATMYVTLEPCNHTGRTGPCTEAILSAGISRVVIGAEDLNPRVKGEGSERLRESGVQVDFAPADLCQTARELNEGFFRWCATGKPFVALKSALTLDGQLALPASGKKEKREWVTSEEARAEVHRMRHSSDALLTGIGTVLADDPLLTDRSGLPRRRKLLRVVLDAKLRLPATSKLVRSASGDLLVFTAAPPSSPRAQKLQKTGAEIVRVPGLRGLLDLKSVLRELGRREILHVLLESGPTLNGAALRAGIVDKLVLFYSPKLAGSATVPFAKGGLSPRKIANYETRNLEFGPEFVVEARLKD